LWIVLTVIMILSAVLQGEFGTHSLIHRIVKFFSLLVEAPIVEEFVFRGALQTALNATAIGASILFGLRGGTILAAIAFALIHLLNLAGGTHLDGVLMEVATALPAGLAFGYLYQRTGNIWYGVFLHGLANLGMP